MSGLVCVRGASCSQVRRVGSMRTECQSNVQVHPIAELYRSPAGRRWRHPVADNQHVVPRPCVGKLCGSDDPVDLPNMPQEVSTSPTAPTGRPARKSSPRHGTASGTARRRGITRAGCEKCAGASRSSDQRVAARPNSSSHRRSQSSTKLSLREARLGHSRRPARLPTG